MNWELILPTGFVVLASLGLVYAAIAAYIYFRWERTADTPRVPVALAAFAVQYGFAFAMTFFRNYHLLPTILMFFVTIGLVTAIRLGLQAHSKAGLAYLWRACLRWPHTFAELASTTSTCEVLPLMIC